MNTAIWVAIIGGVTAILAVTLPLWINNWMNKANKQRDADRLQCQQELEDAKEETRQAIKLAIEQYQNRNF